MNVHPREFEKFMVRLDNDPTVDEKERTLILKQMRICKDSTEFENFLKSIAITKEEAEERLKKTKKTKKHNTK